MKTALLSFCGLIGATWVYAQQRPNPSAPPKEKYVIRATKHAESEILYARILPFEDFQIGTTIIKEF